MLGWRPRMQAEPRDEQAAGGAEESSEMCPQLAPAASRQTVPGTGPACQRRRDKQVPVPGSSGFVSGAKEQKQCRLGC